MNATQSIPPVWITGVGAVSCAGPSSEDLWQASVSAKSQIQDGLGRVFDFSGTNSQVSRPLQMAMTAAREALSQAGWNGLNADDGLILATTTGQIPSWDKPLIAHLQSQISESEFQKAFVHQPLGGLLEDFAAALQFQGQRLLLTSACAASSQALGIAKMWIEQKKVRRCLVGGVEVLCDLTVEGFKSLQLLSPTPAAPFDKNRKGINLSEGAGFLCLEADPKKDKALARISGFGMSTDGFHMTGPHPEGEGSFLALSKAVISASLRPKDLSWIYAHGTGSQQNDLSEGKAISRLLEGTGVPVSSTKGIHGHALGASGAIESVLSVLALQRQTILGSANLNELDPMIPILPAKSSERTKLNHILKNSLGFGGINAALILSSVQSTESFT